MGLIVIVKKQMRILAGRVERRIITADDWSVWHGGRNVIKKIYFDTSSACFQYEIVGYRCRRVLRIGQAEIAHAGCISLIGLMPHSDYLADRKAALLLQNIGLPRRR